MNDQLQKALAAILERAIQGMDTSIAFLTAQLPDVIHQLLLYKLVLSAITFGVCVGALIFLLVLFFRTWRPFIVAFHDTSSASESSAFGYGFLLVILGLLIFFAGVVTANNLTWLKIWLAPKLFLIEYAASLIKH